MITKEEIERVAAAIDSADIGHSMTLVRLVDGVSTYRLEIDGSVEEFTDGDVEMAIDKVYARIRSVKLRKQAESVIAATAPSQDLTSENERLRAGLEKLVTAAQEVNRLGASTGPQWLKLTVSLVSAKAALERT